MKNEASVSAIKEGLIGVGDVKVDLDENMVIVETHLPSSEVQHKIENIGFRAVLQGFGGSSAVVIMSGNEVQGVVRFANAASLDKGCIVDGVLDGLCPGLHGLHIHECGDISQGCDSVGNHYNPHNAPHGRPDSNIDSRHIGDLGNIEADINGRATFRFVDQLLEVPDIIGRSLVVTEQEDDFENSANSDYGRRLACGIIARSAGLNENKKKICACDGVTIWDERNKPIAGKGRNAKY
uniref:superoxide dismutase n=1 Tax=Xenopsylla cheopis TaxID=163159 RepID=A0A6M2DSY7_XENCH